MKDPYPKHGKRRHWYPPWRAYCRCGMDAYPCIVEETLATPFGADERAAGIIYDAGVRYAQTWRDIERRNWSGRA